MRRQRIGVFGGTFNPVHLGHLRSAEEVAERQRLDQVLFVPSGSPPHKSWRGIAPASHRAEMVRLAIAGNPRFRLSTIEVERRGRSYSIDTLLALGSAMPHADLTFIMGLDAFREIATWKSYRRLFELCDIIVTSRASARPPRLRALLPVAARGDFWYLPGATTLRHRTGHLVTFQQLTNLDVSASAIRERIERGDSVRYLVPAAVRRYVLHHRLYAVPGATR